VEQKWSVGTVAGSGVYSLDDGIGTLAKFAGLHVVVASADFKTAWVSQDSFGLGPNTVRKLTLVEGSADEWESSTPKWFSSSGDSELADPQGLVLGSNETELFVGEYGAVSLLNLKTKESTVLAGTRHRVGYKDGVGTHAFFEGVRHLALHKGGEMLAVSDSDNTVL